MLLITVLDGWQYNSEQTTKQIPTFPENFLSNAVFTFQSNGRIKSNAEIQRINVNETSKYERVLSLHW